MKMNKKTPSFLRGQPKERPIRKWIAATALSLFALAAGATEEAADPAFEPIPPPPDELGPPPLFPDQPLPLETPQFGPRTLSKTGNFGTINLGNRQLSRAFYNIVFNASAGTPIQWTGDTDSCNFGTTSEAFKAAVRTRINYFRAMAGVPDNIAFDASYSAKSQEAALMMSRNDDINHNPPNTWSCYTADGALAAQKSNLSYGSNGWDAVFGQMKDNGGNNTAAGHRRWILYPQTQYMGSGDVDTDGSYRKTNSLWIMDSNIWGPRPATRENFVAWPPPGYVPYTVVFPRWSFSYPNADFSASTVTMTKNGAQVPVQQEAVAVNIGERTLVWVPEGMDTTNNATAWPKPTQDTTYHVYVNNVLINGSGWNFDYEVKVFDPAVADEYEIVPQIGGYVTVNVGVPNTYTFSTLNWVSGYELAQTTLSPYSNVEGGESGLANILDGTSADYPLLNTAIKASGNYAFHLAHPTPTTQYFTINREFYIGGNASLQFKGRLGWSAPGQIAKAQISLDSGGSWMDLYSQAGSNGAGQASFSTYNVPLNVFEGRTARFRFAYLYTGGAYYYQTDAGVGFYVDDIQLNNTFLASAPSYTTLNNSGTFTFTAPSAGTYGLQVRAIPWQGFGGMEWGPLLQVTASGSQPSCSGTNLTLSNRDFAAGTSTTCTGQVSISTSGTVRVLSGAQARFYSPRVQLNAGFAAHKGSIFKAASAP